MNDQVKESILQLSAPPYHVFQTELVFQSKKSGKQTRVCSNECSLAYVFCRRSKLYGLLFQA